MARFKFFGCLEGEYPGAKRPGCLPDHVDAVGWMASDGSTHINYNTSTEVLADIPRLLDRAYNSGRFDAEERIKQNLNHLVTGLLKNRIL